MKLLELADRFERAKGKGKMRFSVCQNGGWITTNSEEAVRVLCDLWNSRAEVATALRALAAQPELARLNEGE